MEKKWLVKSLALGIIVLFISAGIVSATNDNFIYKPRPMNTGNTLYVGGSGPNNYTKIQDAINDSLDGDTIYVYNDSSPYFESVIIDKSISLIGENKYSTIIDVQGLELYVVTVNADNVWFEGFTVQNAQYAGVFVLLNNSNIIGNIMQYNSFGVMIYYGEYNVIKDNFIFNNSVSGVDIIGKYNFVTNNYILNNKFVGVNLEGSFNTNVSFNTILGNDYGIDLMDYNRNNTIYQNNITNNKIGIEISMSSMNYVINNNFIDNNINARFARCPIAEFLYSLLFVITENDNYILKNYKEAGRNFWDGNYWNRSRLLPYPILGLRGLFGTIIIIDNFYLPNRIAFDWHPVKTPYDIPTGV